MNFCILKGKVMEEIEFKFFYNNKKVSVAKAKIKIDTGSIIIIKAYNEMADWMYKNIKNNNEVVLYGRLDNKLEIETEGIKIFNSK